jgi:ankyrin repeat protein
MKPTPPGWPRLSVAVFYDDPRAALDHEKTALLLKHGADVHARSSLGVTALLLAARPWNSHRTVEVLLSCGAGGRCVLWILCNLFCPRFPRKSTLASYISYLKTNLAVSSTEFCQTIFHVH